MGKRLPDIIENETGDVSIEKSAYIYTTNCLTPVDVEKDFLSQVNLKKLSIMGIEFSTQEKF